MTESFRYHEHEVPPESIDAVAQGLTDLIPHLRVLSAGNQESWLALHMRITELGGFTPVEASVLRQVVAGLEPPDLVE